MFSGTHVRVKASARHKAVSVTWVAAVLALVGSGCLADPQRSQSVDLLNQLVSARQRLAAQSDVGCTIVGDVQTRLYGEPGLASDRHAWSALHASAEALQAACGQTVLLAQPSNGSLPLTQARERWQNGIAHDIGAACDHLRDAALTLSQKQPC
jgi:hypothetical protein